MALLKQKYVRRYRKEWESDPVFKGLSLIIKLNIVITLPNLNHILHITQCCFFVVVALFMGLHQ